LSTSQPIPAILLAAGASTRLGHPKQLVKVNGETLLHRAARLALEAGCHPVIVVLGAEEAAIRPTLEGLAILPVLNPDWSEGMGSSLHHGMQTMLQASPQTGAVLLLVCDQAKLSREHLGHLMATYRTSQNPIVASRYEKHPGVPAIFSSQFFPDLLKSQGDQGARGLLRRHSVQTSYVNFPEGSADIDTPQDLEALT